MHPSQVKKTQLTKDKIKRARKYGPRITLIDETTGAKVVIPLAPSAGDTLNGKVPPIYSAQSPAAWRVETMPDIAKTPNRANYYKKSFTDPITRRYAWQYMFGGIFRAIFGIYAPTKYWDKELEKDVEEGLRQSYSKSKASGDYGVYSCIAAKAFRLKGRPWRYGQPSAPYTHAVVTPEFWVRRGTTMEIRINKLDFNQPRVDIELRLVNFRKSETRIYTCSYDLFLWWVKKGRIKRIKEGKVYAFKTYGSKSARPS